MHVYMAMAKQYQEDRMIPLDKFHLDWTNIAIFTLRTKFVGQTDGHCYIEHSLIRLKNQIVVFCSLEVRTIDSRSKCDSFDSSIPLL